MEKGKNLSSSFLIQVTSDFLQGLFGGRWYFKLFNLGMGLGGLVMACLGMFTHVHPEEIDNSNCGNVGMWGAGESIKAVFANSAAATSFGCKAPV